ncbi:TonB-dependent receptor [Chryseobacterium phosphatilyticum]|uniref:TonB-dependent receptor n=1 Tax=Chryseobacterium phosphatilyticum TaxID=475075 RepID=A0A316X828_9FLAO|nr:TonB-dependent receptor [Chryseobacterium phosphatilyticum]PWN69932.1 TonB-dependent receptor [Chryseobacterium phosphatilyticum]
MLQKNTLWRQQYYRNTVLPAVLFFASCSAHGKLPYRIINYGQEYEYCLVSQTVFLEENQKILLPSVASFGDLNEVTGVVFDRKGKPVSGAKISVKGKNIETTTDAKGSFRIKADVLDVLLIEAPGYTPKELVVDANTTMFQIELHVNGSKNDLAKAIDEVVVVGFGKQKKENITGAVSTITEKAIEGRPINNAIQALQGTVAGLNFSLGTGGGQLDNALSFTIRGTGTVGNTSSAPLILIDGVEGDLKSLNPRDIASISVLKDAASASIYGSRAPFGVVLVTTKTGRSGKPVVSYDLMTRFSNPLLQPSILDSESFAYYFNEAAKNAGQNQVFSAETIQKIKDYKEGRIKDGTEWNAQGQYWRTYNEGFANVNWFKEFYRKWVPSTENNLSIRGGAEKINYYFSANWLGTDGLMRHNPDKLNRYSLNGKITTQFLPFLQLNYSNRFTRTDYGSSGFMGALFYHNIARRWPTNAIRDTFGNYMSGNEIQELENSNRRNQEDILTQQVALVFTPIKNWETRAEFNYITTNTFVSSSFLPIYKYDGNGTPIPVGYDISGLRQPGTSLVEEFASKRNFFNTNIYTTYEKQLDHHHFKIMMGMQSELNKSQSLRASRDMLYSTDVIAIDATYGKTTGVGGSRGHWATFGVFGRLNYNYKQRYLVEVSTRYDGTSRFLRDQRWNVYPAVSVGWNMSKEEFWKSLGSFARAINDFKLRFSYGSLGNQNTDKIGWYPFFQSMPLYADNGSWLINGQRTNTAYAPGMVSRSLTWERVTTWNYGIDFAAFQNKLTMKFDYFRRKTFDMVSPAPGLPATFGTAVPDTNNADMESKGFELEVGWRGKIGQDFSYNINGVLSDNRQKVTRYNNETGNLDYYYAGRYLGEIWGYKTKGIAKTDEEMNEWLKKNNQDRLGGNWAAGDIMYEDLNGDGKVDDGNNTLSNPGDRRIIGNSTPRYNFGLNISMEYKGFDCSFLFQGVGKRDVNLGTEPYFVGANVNLWKAAAFQQHLNYFRPANTDSPFGPNVDSYYPRPIFDSGTKNFAAQTRWIQNGAYIRLKNIQFGYSLPKDMLRSLGISNLRVYLSAENVFTITSLSKIFDPETINGAWGSGKVYPLSKVISTGLSLTF